MEHAIKDKLRLLESFRQGSIGKEKMFVKNLFGFTCKNRDSVIYYNKQRFHEQSFLKK